MKFKIGQRVRFIGGKSLDDKHPYSKKGIPVGAIGTVVSYPCIYTCVLFDLYRSEHKSGAYACEDHRLEPLDDEAEFKRFMEKTMTPVQFTPVNAQGEWA